MAASLFTRVDDRAVVPTERARGPWDPGALHGGPVAALLARAVEAGIDPDAMLVARLTIELERSVPVKPMVTDVTVVRPGRKVMLIDATLRLASDDAVLARARALLVRRAEVVLPHDDPHLGPHLATASSPTPPHAGRPGTMVGEYEAFHNTGVEMRFVDDETRTVGPATVWMRLCQPLLSNEALTPLQRVAAAADFGNGVSRVLDFTTHLFINPELTIHQFRPAVGEWIGLDAVTHHGPDGVGLAETAIYDEAGQLGRGAQSLFIDRR